MGVVQEAKIGTRQEAGIGTGQEARIPVEYLLDATVESKQYRMQE